MSKNTSAPDKEDESSDRNMVGSIGLVYSGVQNTAFRALVSQGYRSANLTQMFVGSGVIIPNPELKPEKSNNFEIGARFDNGILVTDLALFHSRFKDGIAYEVVDPNASSLTYNTKNVDKVKSWGLEWGVDVNIPETGFTPYGTLNLLRYETEDADGFKTKHASRPTAWGSLGLKWEKEILENGTLFADANVLMSEGAYTRNPDGTKKDKTDSWQTANFTIGLIGGEEHKYNVSLSLRNIFDEDYQIAAPFSPSSPLPEPGFHTVLSFGYEF
jgi:hemoglobin/transferrin/lactoferrin receptor protein